MKPSTADQRRAERFATEIPVEVAGHPGRTQNVSDSGVYFETDVRHDVGARVQFTVELTLGGQKQRLRCEGEVVRVDGQGQRIGVAARLLEPFFADSEQVEAPPPPGEAPQA